MANLPKTRAARKSARIEARCGKRLKRRLLQAKKSTGYDEADFLLTALEEFFAQHKSPTEQIAAVQRSRQAMQEIEAARQKKEAA